jgi:hypothetical protein
MKQMQVHKLTVMIIDHDELGADGVIEALENGRFGNRCISPHVMESASVDIGEWTDDCALNSASRSGDEFQRLFDGVGMSRAD